MKIWQLNGSRTQTRIHSQKFLTRIATYVHKCTKNREWHTKRKRERDTDREKGDGKKTQRTTSKWLFGLFVSFCFQLIDTGFCQFSCVINFTLVLWFTVTTSLGFLLLNSIYTGNATELLFQPNLILQTKLCVLGSLYFIFYVCFFFTFAEEKFEKESIWRSL